MADKDKNITHSSDSDYMLIMEEQRAKREREELKSGKPEMNIDRSELELPEIPHNTEKSNRFDFDIERDIKQNVDLSDLGKGGDKYSSNYRPKEKSLSEGRLYRNFSGDDNISKEDVKQLFSHENRRSSQRKAPIRKPVRSVEERRAELDEILPDDAQLALRRMAEEREKRKQLIPSILREDEEEKASEPVPEIENVPINTPLRESVKIPGYEYRRRYLHSGLNTEGDDTLPERAGFGGAGGRTPDFESETKNWSSMSSEELFAPVVEKERVIIPMQEYNDQDTSSAVRKHTKKKANIAPKTIKEEYQEQVRRKNEENSAIKEQAQRRRELEERRKSREKRRAAMRVTGPSVPEEEIAGAAYSAGLSNAQILREREEQAELEKKHAQIAQAMDIVEGINEPRQSAPMPVYTGETEASYYDQQQQGDKSFEAYIPETVGFGRVEGEDESDYVNESFEMTQDEAPPLIIGGEISRRNTDYDIKQRGGKLNRKKSAYSYLFDDNEPMPENLSEYARVHDNSGIVSALRDESGGDYSYLYINDEYIDRQVSMTEETVSVDDEADPFYKGKSHNFAKIEETVEITDEGLKESHYDRPGRDSTINQGFAGITENTDVDSDYSQINMFDPLFEDTYEEHQSNQIRRKMKTFTDDMVGIGTSAAIRIKEQFKAEDTDYYDEYTEKDKTEDIKGELYDKLSEHVFRIVSSGISFVLLLIPEVLAALGIRIPALGPSVPVVYYGLSTVIVLFSAIICKNTIFMGLKGLFRKKPDGNFAFVTAFIAVLLQNVFLIFAGNSESVRSFALIYVLALLLNELGMFINIIRVGRNFTFISGKGKRGAVILADDDEGGNELGSFAGETSPIMAYPVKAGFLSDFLTFAYEKDPSESASSNLAIPLSIASVIAGVAAWFMSGVPMAGLSAFAAASVISIPMTRTLSINFPLSNITRKLLKKGAMLSGWAAVDEFSDVNVLAIGEEMLFPASKIELMGIKVFGDQRIDRVILDSAAITINFGGSIAKVFETIIRDRKDILPAVDQAEYQEDLGFCGWVGGRRILIGNMELMKKFGIDQPPRDYDKIYESEGSNLLYLAAGGTLTAMFVLRYHVDTDTALAVRKLEETGVRFVVRSFDININAKMIAGKYKIPERKITVIPQALNGTYNALAGSERENAPAVLGTNRSLKSMAAGLAAAISIKSSLAIAVMLQTIGAVLGFILAAVLSLSGTAIAISPIQMLLYLLFWFAAVLLVPRLKR